MHWRVITLIFFILYLIPVCNVRTAPWNKRLPLGSRTYCTSSTGAQRTRALRGPLGSQVRPTVALDFDLY